MSQPICIQLENVSKRYWLYTRYRERFGQIFLQPFTRRDYARSFWALNDVSLEVRQGETLGVIGVNGSGKSTLLQIVAGTLQPTHGQVKVNGRLTALLELGAGFHTEFTGRENIYLNGATLGISQKEMRRRVDQIIDFAGIGEFIDQPVKLYSSGMYVRLAFSIATSVDPEVLVVDEALAVGDIGFVIKCMHRMHQLREQGTAIILVTHDVQTVRSFCDSALWLAKGKPMMYGSPSDVTSQYIQHLWNQQVEGTPSGESSEGSRKASSDFQQIYGEMIRPDSRSDLVRWGKGDLVVEGFQIDNGLSNGMKVFEYGQHLTVCIQLRAQKDIGSEDMGVGISLRNIKGLDIITSTTYDAGNRLPPLRKGQAVRVTFSFDNILAPGDYALVISAEDRTTLPPQYLDYIENAVMMKVVSRSRVYSMVLPPVHQIISIEE
jgi:lipopolysaccharide transport system ATP-binding protein